MFPHTFSSMQFYQKKRDIVLYKACDDRHRYILKGIIPKDLSAKQAFCDEYHTLKTLKHPSIPVYYGLEEQFRFPGLSGDFLTLCMEDCSVHPEQEFKQYELQELGEILCKITDVLSYLLDHGILYTDLNPSNLIISRQQNNLQLTLVDFTYCYYFLRNPNPSYSLRFSYDLSPHLKGRQMLVQEITYLACALMESQAVSVSSLSSRILRLLETGKNPPEGLSLEEFSIMIKESFI